MNPETIANLFSKTQQSDEAQAYLREEGALDFLTKYCGTTNEEFSPQFNDLARLHKSIRERKVFTIIEFGVGFSTIIMAHALLLNQRDWNNLSSKPSIRNSNPFQLHTIDASEKWLAVTESKIPSELKSIITLHHSNVTAGLFQDRSCHFYDVMPDIVPDFIYLDGPDPQNVIPNQYGTWKNLDKLVMAGDILRMEPLLLPGTCIIVDGRTANARFLSSHFYRKWDKQRSVDGDITVFELQEPPLGKINSSTLKYCLGIRSSEWL